MQRTTPLLHKRHSRRYVYVCVVLVILEGRGGTTDQVSASRQAWFADEAKQHASAQASMAAEAGYHYTNHKRKRDRENGSSNTANSSTKHQRTKSPGILGEAFENGAQPSYTALTHTASLPRHHTQKLPHLMASVLAQLATLQLGTSCLQALVAPPRRVLTTALAVCVCIWVVVCVLAPHLLQGCLCTSFNSHASPKQAQRGG